MRRLILLSFVVALIIPHFAYAGSVKGYYRTEGTYVSPSYRSTPNNTVKDNYSYKGNSNPFTGKSGSNYNRQSPSSDYYGTSGRSKSSFGTLKGFKSI